MTKEEWMQICEKAYEKIGKLPEKPNLYEYEKSLVSELNRLGKEVFTKDMEGISKDHRKKNVQNDVGEDSSRKEA